MLDALSELRDEVEFAKNVTSVNARELLDPHEVLLIHGNSRLVVAALKSKNLTIFVAESWPSSAAAHAAAAELASASRTPIVIPETNIASVMHRVSKVVLQAHGVARNGDAVVDAGAYALGLVARQHGVPVLLLCNQLQICPVPDGASFSVDTQIGNPQDVMPLEAVLGLASDTEVVHSTLDLLPGDAVSFVVTDAQVAAPSQLPAIVYELYGGLAA